MRLLLQREVYAVRFHNKIMCEGFRFCWLTAFVLHSIFTEHIRDQQCIEIVHNNRHKKSPAKFFAGPFAVGSVTKAS